MSINKIVESIVFSAGVAFLTLGNMGIAVADTFKLTAGSSHPPVISFVKGLPEVVVKQSIKQASVAGHTIKWTQAYAGVLYNFQNTLEGIEDGLADVGWVGTLWEASKLPLQNITYFAPGITNDVSLLTKIGNQLNEKVPAAAAAWKKYNQVPLAIHAGAPYILLTKKPINKVEDLKGLKLYTPGAIARWVEGTGAVGVDGGLPVMYEGVRNGITDGLIIPITTVLPFKIHEVAPYATQLDLGAVLGGALSMNLDTWNKLPVDMQKMFKKIGAEYAKFVVKLEIGFAAKTIAILKSNPKVTVSTLPDAEMKKWAGFMPNIAGDWAKSNGKDAETVLRFVMEETRKAGHKPLRDWDKQLNQK